MTSEAQKQANGNTAVFELQLTAESARLLNGAMPRCMVCPRKVRSGPWRSVKIPAADGRMVEALEYVFHFGLDVTSSLGGSTRDELRVVLRTERAQLCSVVLYLQGALLSREHVDATITEAMPNVLHAFGLLLEREGYAQFGTLSTGTVHVLDREGRSRCSRGRALQVVLPGALTVEPVCSRCITSVFRDAGGLEALTRAYVAIARLEGVTILGRCDRCAESGR